MGEERARIESTAGEVTEAIRTAALYGDGSDPHEQLFLRVDTDAVETPASPPDAAQTSYCTLSETWFDRLWAEHAVDALVPVERILTWLDWFDVDEQIRVSFRGQSVDRVATEIEISGDKRSATVDCIDDPAIVSSLELWLPDQFEDGVFYQDGTPFPTQIETTTTALDRICGAAHRCDLDSYPLRVVGGSLSLSVRGTNARASESLDATVDGPDIDEWYGSGFARFVRAVEGTVTLQTGPGYPLVAVRDAPGVTLRLFIHPDDETRSR
jgi:hypothetical protein